MRKEFKVQSSDGVTTYVVGFLLESSKLHVFCVCPAGVLGKWCKHKMQLISGEVSGVLGCTDVADMVEVQNWIRNSEFPRLLDEMKMVEKEMQIAKIKMNNVKKTLEKAAWNGVAA